MFISIIRSPQFDKHWKALKLAAVWELMRSGLCACENRNEVEMAHGNG